MNIYDIHNPEDRARLPKWAQHQIETLIRNNKHLARELEAGPEDSNTFASPYVHPRPLGMSPDIRFGGLGFADTFDVRCRDGELQVSGNAGGRESMCILPRATNSFRVVFK